MTGYQIPRNSLAWLLAAQAAVIAPHVTRLPLWVVGVCIGCIVWRVMVYQGRWNYPGRWTKVLFVLAGLIGVPVGYRTILGLEPAIALLIVAFVLKLLEMQHKRDAYVVVLLGYFVAMTQFLFFQTIPWTAYMYGVVMMITAGLVGLNQTLTHHRPLVTLKTAFALIAQSIPLMIVLFVLFPRIPPLWTVPMPSQVARSGVSDVVSPGDIASLAASSELAFKATFEGDAPPPSQLYWRGLTLTRFDGRAWEQDDRLAFRQAWQIYSQVPTWAREIVRKGAEYQYSIIIEPTQQNWLFALNVPTLPRGDDLVMARDFRLAIKEPLHAKYRYDVVSDLSHDLEVELHEFWRYRYTLLPEDGLNQRSRDLAAELYASSNGPEDYLGRVLRRYTQQEFVYTLRPTVLGENSIDEFLFDTQRGFCEHYASSFAFLMRAAGIPARVVVGYQGGEYNPIANYYAVFQYDAHAWAEVWLEGRGWVRVDPVTAVAPNRIEQGLEAAIQEEQTFLAGSPLSAATRSMLWLVEIRLQLSAINHYWDSWVVGYTPALQAEMIANYFGDVDRKELGMIMLSTFFGLLALIGLIVLMKRPHRLLAPIDREYLKFCRALERQGLGRRIGEGPYDYASRVAEARPELERPVADVTDAYVASNYAVSGETPDIARLRRAVRTFRLRTLG
jgi:transglutaminase-like putative cysteine protease